MKKNILLSALTLLAISCKQTPKIDYEILSGQIANANGKTFYLNDVFGEKVDSLILNDKNEFTDTLKLQKGYYKLAMGREYTWMYLQPGDNMKISFDAKAFDKTLKYEGVGAKTNNYLAQKMLLGIALKPKTAYQFYGNLKEKDFLKLEDSIANAYDKLLENNKLNADFSILEKFRHKLGKANILSRYQMLKRYLTKDNEYKVSKNFPDPMNGIDINDARLASLPNASYIVGEYLQYQINQQEKTDDDNPIRLMQMIDQKLTDPKLKEILAFDNAKYNLLYTKKLEKYYALFNKMVKNPKYKEIVQKKYDNIKAMNPGVAAPDFTAYDINGKEYHLKDFEGKMLYIDLWATWCAPCRAEIPSLNKIREQYKNQAINILSISVYDDKAKWETMVKADKMQGWQLFSPDKDMEFLKKFVVDGIPRFILLDSSGKIIDNNAPRPSEEELKLLLNKHLQTR